MPTHDLAKDSPSLTNVPLRLALPSERDNLFFFLTFLDSALKRSHIPDNQLGGLIIDNVSKLNN